MSPKLVANRAATLIAVAKQEALFQAMHCVQMARDAGPAAREFHAAVLAEVQRRLDERPPVRRMLG